MSAVWFHRARAECGRRWGKAPRFNAGLLKIHTGAPVAWWERAFIMWHVYKRFSQSRRARRSISSVASYLHVWRQIWMGRGGLLAGCTVMGVLGYERVPGTDPESWKVLCSDWSRKPARPVSHRALSSYTQVLPDDWPRHSFGSFL